MVRAGIGSASAASDSELGELMTFVDRYGPWTLVLGGSEGIGASFARLLAADGLNVALAARRTQPLEELANELAAET